MACLASSLIAILFRLPLMGGIQGQLALLAGFKISEFGCFPT
jgi:hypothetical protein